MFIDKPRNITIEPIKDHYEPGETLSCSAVARPDPSYHWLTLDSTAESVAGPDIKIHPSENKSVIYYVCVAGNFVGNMSLKVTVNISRPYLSGTCTCIAGY